MTAISGFVWAVACFLLVIGPLIFIHELGHYFVGRWFGVKADAFSIGFGRELVGWTDKRGTRWKVAALPLGGYVKFAGDMSPVSEPTAEWLQLPAAERAQTFQAKPVWQRFLIVLAGPAVNMLMAVLLFAMLLSTYGEPFTPPVISKVLQQSPAEIAGLRPGDRITAIDGEPMRRFQDVSFYVQMHPDTDMDVDVVRDGQTRALSLHSRSVMQDDGSGGHSRIGLLGVESAGGAMQRVAWRDLPSRSIDYTWTSFKATFTGLFQVLSGQRSPKELNGPVGVARIAGQMGDLGLFAMLALMAGISINLGFINLLPIPMLDGGHLLFYIVEGIRRRPVEPQVQEWAFRSGLALLLGLMLFVTFNDLGTVGLWQRLASLAG